MTRPTVAQGTWNIRCPACRAPNMVAGYDCGAYNGIEVIVDCKACGTNIHTFTLVLIVSALTPDAAQARARSIIPASAEVVPWPEEK